MRFFLDTEFMEAPGQLELISIGIVSQDGQEYYAETVEGDRSKANDWVKANVLPQLEGPVKPQLAIGADIIEFVGSCEPEFWGYYADYDWVVFCWLFGAMIDLPKGWLMYCRDIKQLADSVGNPKLPATSGEHHALSDARWNRCAWLYLQSLGSNDRQGDERE